MTNAVYTKQETCLRKFSFILSQPADRDVLAGLFACIFFSAYVVPLFANVEANGLTPLHTAEVIGFIAVAVVLKRLGPDSVLSRWDLVAVMVAGVAIVHPWHRMGAAVLTFLGLIFVARKDARLASLGQLCLGLAWIGLWGYAVLTLIEPWLLPIEAALGYLPLRLFDPSFSLVGNSILGKSGHGIIVYTACSSFGNTVTAAFLWLSLLKIRGTEFRVWHFSLLGASLIMIIILNTLRLTLMAYSYEGYAFWHNGYGANVMSFAMLSAVLGFFYIALYRGEREQ